MSEQNSNLESLRYPIGKFVFPDALSEASVTAWINDISNLPDQLIQLVDGWSEEQFLRTYRNGSWNCIQLINHLIDSHSNAIIRFKLALTEDYPTIRPYKEQLFAQLADSINAPVDQSLLFIKLMHARWVIMLNSIQKVEWERKLFHPESKRDFTLYQLLALYAWHGKHHLTHIKIAQQN